MILRVKKEKNSKIKTTYNKYAIILNVLLKFILILSANKEIPRVNNNKSKKKNFWLALKLKTPSESKNQSHVHLLNKIMEERINNPSLCELFRFKKYFL
tara:strand:+ start:685 stop:981 length:297 start_codon:yes stop_codon:yes gene_type:complete